MEHITVAELIVLLKRCPQRLKVFIEHPETPDDIFSVGGVYIEVEAESKFVVIRR